MNLCSLEDQDYNELFITQEARNIVPLVQNDDGDFEMDLGVDLLEIGKGNKPHYSDISDADDFEMPSLQAPPPM